MKLNKTYTVVLTWLIHFYVFYGMNILYQHYQSDVLHITFKDIKSSLEFILFVPIVSIMLGIYYPIFLSVIVMIVLVEYKKYKIFKSYILSILFFFIVYLFLFTRVNYLKYDLEWIVSLISLIITSLIIYIVFKKTFARIDKEYNLK